MPIQLTECAAEYARLWTTRERELVAELGSVDRSRRLRGLERAGGYFRVSRTFPVAFDREQGLARLSPALDALDAVAPDAITAANLPRCVRALRAALGQPYGGRDLLSAATKFLWLRNRDISVIYDSQARAALGTPAGDYDGYLERWFAEYELRREAVADAAMTLTRRDAPGASASGVEDVAPAEWFQRRVFDTYLWRVGKPASVRRDA